LTLQTILATVALGALVGGVGGMFGIGGGLIAIPTLGLVYGFDQQTAQGTTLVSVVPNVFLGLWHYRRRVGIDARTALILAVTAAAATHLAARFATGFDPTRLRLAFAGFLAAIAAYAGYRLLAGPPRAAARAALNAGWAALIGVLGGAVSGLFGVGGAFVAPPLLTSFFGLSQAAAQGLGLALVAPSAVTALYTYAAAGQVDWAAGLPLALGGLSTISAGVALAHHLPERTLRLLFCGLLLATAGLLVWHG
jgi:uncharacterized membrane protein YfcA